MSFTAHNVLLKNGTRTWPSHQPIEEHPWLLAATRTLKSLYPNGFEGLKLVDLGALEGGFAAEFARLGFETLGIEVRSSNIANCRIVEAGMDLPNLEFVQDDVQNLARYGRFDVVFCCGILYHLDNPRKFLEIMAGCGARVVIINTHFATQELNSTFSLSEIHTNEGLSGRWYAEHHGPVESELDALKWHSWKNQSSFWPLKPDLIQAIKEAGFPLVYEQYDFLDDPIADQISFGTYAVHNRGMFVGVRA